MMVNNLLIDSLSLWLFDQVDKRQSTRNNIYLVALGDCIVYLILDYDTWFIYLLTNTLVINVGLGNTAERVVVGVGVVSFDSSISNHPFAIHSLQINSLLVSQSKMGRFIWVSYFPDVGAHFWLKNCFDIPDFVLSYAFNCAISPSASLFITEMPSIDIFDTHAV